MLLPWLQDPETGIATHRLLSSSFLGLPYKILNINHKKQLLRSLWVSPLAAVGNRGQQLQ